jgi:hypothetical protein
MGGRDFGNVHCAGSNETLAQIACAPRVRGHGDGAAGEGVGFDHVAGEGAEHGADGGC